MTESKIPASDGMTDRLERLAERMHLDGNVVLGVGLAESRIGWSESYDDLGFYEVIRLQNMLREIELNPKRWYELIGPVGRLT